MTTLPMTSLFAAGFALALIALSSPIPSDASKRPRSYNKGVFLNLCGSLGVRQAAVMNWHPNENKIVIWPRD
jgi:hypothetical protein